MIKNIEKTIIKVKVKDEQFELPKEIKKEIEEFWNQCKTENSNLWNGELMCVGECERKGNYIEITCKKSNYAHYLYDERI